MAYSEYNQNITRIYDQVEQLRSEWWRKVQIFRECHKILKKNIPIFFMLPCSVKRRCKFFKFCGLLTISELQPDARSTLVHTQRLLHGLLTTQVLCRLHCCWSLLWSFSLEVAAIRRCRARPCLQALRAAAPLAVRRSPASGLLFLLCGLLYIGA